MIDKPANKLIHSSSPYLLQHAYNPVNWQPWSKEAFEEAKERDVPVILSIGYSSCHWCHVMEHESFENDEIAAIMNHNFVCIKVDREERPDIDQIYMEAIQVMGINGGWPLNVFITPDQKPFYGGTYFPPVQWKQVCLGVSKAFKENKIQLNDSAEQFFHEVQKSDLEKYGITTSESKPDFQVLYKVVNILQNKFDKEYGGFSRAPKFPMPSIWKFLLYANSILNEKEVGGQLEKTLDEMAKGGIYDQIGGGFSRYSVDAKWLVPHFEKMLYDNGQLLSLYSEAYRIFPKQFYKDVVYDTIHFLKNELMSEEGGFYSALDADSEGVEGKYYVWSANELKEILKEDYSLFAEYSQVDENGNWEEGKNILHLKKDPEEFAHSKKWDTNEFLEKVKKWKSILLSVRSERIKPGLDDKILAGWNGLCLKGLTDAYRTFNEPQFLDMAIKNGEFITEKLILDKELRRTAGKEKVNAFLEDYAFVIDGFINLYQCTFDEKWIMIAKDLAEVCMDNFYDKNEEMFFFTSSNSENLIARKKEIFDNVIPSSNSQMAINLYLLSKFYYEEKYESISRKMISRIQKLIENDPAYLTNWAILYFYQSFDTVEISFLGKKANHLAHKFDQSAIFNKIISGTTNHSDLPILTSRKQINDQDTIYVCYNKTCKLPVHTVEEALKQIKLEPERP